MENYTQTNCNKKREKTPKPATTVTRMLKVKKEKADYDDLYFLMLARMC